MKNEKKMKLGLRNPLPKQQNRAVTRIKTKVEQKDLEALVQAAEKAGPAVAEKAGRTAQSEAKIISVDKIVVDERVRWKCIIPICFGYGSSPNCPPHSPTAEEMRRIVSGYEYGIFLRYMPPVSDHVYPDFIAKGGMNVNELNEVVSIVETEAQYQGYPLAMGFKGGPCCLCGLFSPEWLEEFFEGKTPGRCPVFQGKTCHHYLQARPALEACSVDVFATARNVGWDTYLPLPEHPEESVPCVSWYGLVLVG